MARPSAFAVLAFMRGPGRRRRHGDDEVDLQAGQVGGEAPEAIELPVRRPVLDRDAPALDVAVVAEPLPERLQGHRHLGGRERAGAQEADAGDLRRAPGAGRHRRQRDADRE